MIEIRPIDYITTMELIDELMKRCECGIFIGVKNEDAQGNTTFWHQTGNLSTCYGLCHQMAYNIQNEDLDLEN